MKITSSVTKDLVPVQIFPPRNGTWMGEDIYGNVYLGMSSGDRHWYTCVGVQENIHQTLGDPYSERKDVHLPMKPFKGTVTLKGE